MKTEKKKRAFALILDGYSIRQVAKEVGVHRSTVERWSKQEDWQVAKVIRHDKLIQEMRAEMNNPVSKKLLTITASLFDTLEHAIAENRLFIQGKISKRNKKFNYSDICNIALAVSKLSTTESEFIINKLNKVKTQSK